MRRRSRLMLVAFAACALAACGRGEDAQPGSDRATTKPTAIALGQAPAKPGELYFNGEVSPGSHGPFRIDGRYLVRFEQAAPENPSLDFTGQTAFTASLRRRAGDPRGAVKLFGAATRTGRRELRLHGRYVLDVSFGDFPYAVRFTPRR